MKEPLKVGDRVAVYGNTIATGSDKKFVLNGDRMTVSEVHLSGWVHVLLEGNEEVIRFYVHPNQCRKLVKRKRRRVWLEKEKVQELDRNPAICPKSIVRLDNFVGVGQWVEFVEVIRK